MKRRVDLRPMPDPSRRRLLYVQPCSSFGGAERQASLNVPRLRESGFDVLPLVGPSQTIVRWLNDNGVDVIVRPGTERAPAVLDISPKTSYVTFINNGPNSLHGGLRGVVGFYVSTHGPS